MPLVRIPPAQNSTVAASPKRPRCPHRACRDRVLPSVTSEPQGAGPGAISPDAVRRMLTTAPRGRRASPLVVAGPRSSLLGGGWVAGDGQHVAHDQLGARSGV